MYQLLVDVKKEQELGQRNYKCMQEGAKQNHVFEPIPLSRLKN